MKHILWAACLFLLGTSPLQAQDQAGSQDRYSGVDSVYARQVAIDKQPREWYYGVRLGTSLSNFGGDTDSTSNKIGILLGAFVGKDLSTQLSVLAGIQYLKKGATISSDSAKIGLAEAPNGMTLNAAYTYISVPIQVRYFPWEKNGAFIEGGLEASVLLGAELIGLGGEYAQGDGHIGIEDQLNSIDFGSRIGLGYEWRQGLEFSAVYNQGMINTLSEGNYRVTNRSWQFVLGYRF